jgi:hypothetical protein
VKGTFTPKLSNMLGTPQRTRYCGPLSLPHAVHLITGWTARLPKL